MSQTSTADVVVIGLGAVGSATLHRLARSGVRAIGVDRFHPPHDKGSSHGETRITRVAIAEGQEYVPLARRSHEIWRELEAETGESLFHQIGLLIIAEGDQGPSHGKASFIRSQIEVADANAVPYEMLDSAEIHRRYPQFLLRGPERAYFEPGGGVLEVEKCVAVQLQLAQALGATVRTGETVRSIEPSGSGVAVTTDKGRIEAGRAVLTAGSWLPGLAGDAVRKHTTVHRQVVLWFRPNEPRLYEPASCPPFIWFQGAGEEDYLYGFPLLGGTAGVKAATERYPGHVEPDAVDRVVTEAEAQAVYDRHVAGYLRGVTRTLVKASTCLYTVSPDAGFIVDRLQDGRVLAASACSGHGFKHSPALGERLAIAATQSGALEPAFALSRFG